MCVDREHNEPSPRGRDVAAQADFFRAYAAVGHATATLDGRFLHVNRAFCELTGYAEAELLAMRMQDITVPEDVAPNLEYDRRLLAGEISHFNMEKRYRRKDGGIVTVLLSASAVYDADGVPQYLVGLVQDISERKRVELELQRANDELEQRVQARTAELWAANERLVVELRERMRVEEALRASEERLRTVVSNAPVVLFAVDTDGVFTLSEGKGLKVLGLAPGEVVGRSVFELYQDAPAIHEHIRRALAGEAFNAMAAVNGLAFEVWYAPMYGQDGTVSGAIGVATDISERKRAEEERIAFEQLRSDFIANISHDLRTPLHHIKGYAALLLQRHREIDTRTRHDFLQTIVDSSDQLSRLVGDLLDTSRIETGTLSLQIGDLQIDALARAAIRRWQGISTHQFEARIAPDIPRLHGDAARIAQVLDNLLANVVRHTPDHTQAELIVERAGQEVVVSVQDHGPGISAEHLPHLFDRFYQAAQLSVGPRRGSGLGLFICKWIVEQHGGRIWVESTPGQGTTFYFTLALPGG